MYPPLATRSPMTITTGFSCPEVAGLDVQAFAGGGAAARGVQLDDHRFDRVVSAGVFDILADPIGRPLGDDGVRQTYHADVGFAGRHVDEKQRTGRYAHAHRNRREDVPASQHSSQSNENTYGAPRQTFTACRRVFGRLWTGSPQERRFTKYAASSGFPFCGGRSICNVDRTVTPRQVERNASSPVVTWLGGRDRRMRRQSA